MSNTSSLNTVALALAERQGAAVELAKGLEKVMHGRPPCKHDLDFEKVVTGKIWYFVCTGFSLLVMIVVVAITFKGWLYSALYEDLLDMLGVSLLVGASASYITIWIFNNIAQKWVRQQIYRYVRGPCENRSHAYMVVLRAWILANNTQIADQAIPGTPLAHVLVANWKNVQKDLGVLCRTYPGEEAFVRFDDAMNALMDKRGASELAVRRASEQHEADYGEEPRDLVW